MEDERYPIDRGEDCSSCPSLQFCKESLKTYHGPFCEVILKNKDTATLIFSEAQRLAEDNYKTGEATDRTIWSELDRLLESSRWEYCMEYYNLFVTEGKMDENGIKTFQVFIRLYFNGMEGISAIFYRKFFLGKYEEIPEIGSEE